LLTKRVQDGEMADALILIKGNVDTLLKDGKVAPGSDALFATSIFAVGVKTGAPKPDISTPDAFKQSLLAAKAVSYTDPASGGASGIYTAKQIERMGITEQMKGKTKHPPSGGFSGSLLVAGEADIAINSKPELLSVSGVEVVGPLPGDMAFTVVYAAAVGAAATQPDAAKALVKFLTSPEAQAVFKAKGFDPA
jgi:molybdate transport system substrate-binding protein